MYIHICTPHSFKYLENELLQKISGDNFEFDNLLGIM